MKTEKNVAHYDLIKQQNKKVIRNLLRYENSLTVSQIAKQTGLTYPTCAGNLKELWEEEQVKREAEAESTGGRPGVVYQLNEAYKYGANLYFEEWTLQAVVYDYRGRRCDSLQWSVKSEITVGNLVDIVQEMKKKYEHLDSVAIGIPGVTKDGEIFFLPKFPQLVRAGLKQAIEERVQVNVFLENDLNAMAYAKAEERKNFAMIAYINQCVGSGIVLDGKLHVGSHGYAGELEGICTDVTNKIQTLEECIFTFMCVLDLPEFWIMGDECNEELLEKVRERLKKRISEDRMPQLRVADDLKECYERGLLRGIMEKWEKEM